MKLRIFALSMLAFLEISCSVSTNEKALKSNLSFSWFVAYNWFSPPNAWGTDPVSAWLQQNKQVRIDWQSGIGDSSALFNRLMSGEELPDVLCVDRGAIVARLAEAGLILPLDPYLDVMPNFKKWLGSQNISLLRNPDGKLYQFPNWYLSSSATVGGGNAGWAINTEIYKQLGSPALTTFDDLETYLMQVKKRYPNVVPLESCDNFQLAPLVYRAQDVQLRDNMTNYLGTVRAGSFTPVFKDPYVQDTFIYLSRLFRKGLINADAFTQTRDQVIQKLVNGNAAVIATWDVGSTIKRGNDQNILNTRLYNIIWPPVKKGIDPSKVTLSGYQTLGWNVNVFSVKAKDRLGKILQYLDWLTGEEGQRILSFGPPGYFWEKTDGDGIPIWNDRYTEASQNERESSGLFAWNWVGNASYVNNAKVIANNRLPEAQKDYMVEWQRDVMWKTSRNENEFAYERPKSDSEIGMIQTRIADIYDDTTAKAVFANSDDKVRAILRSGQQEMDTAGYARFLEYHNQKYHERVQLLQEIP